MKCEFCEKEFKGSEYHQNRNLKKHIIYCRFNPNRLEYICKYCGKIEETRGRIGSHTSNCLKNPDIEKIRLKRIESGKKSIPHSEETKQKISKIRKEYLQKNPDKVPYLLNHSRNESYPEKYFTDVFKNEEIEVVKYFKIGIYELDFCIPERKIDIEIDGSQHYYDKRIVESDNRRTKFLEDSGWDVIRIRWSDFKRLSINEKKYFISNIKSYINNLISIKPFIEEKGKN